MMMMLLRLILLAMLSVRWEGEHERRRRCLQCWRLRWLPSWLKLLLLLPVPGHV
jgi:hypothetical protein